MKLNSVSVCEFERERVEHTQAKPMKLNIVSVCEFFHTQRRQ
jgi:hypothetical protein